jgi:type IV pilus assembly protein PilV
MRSRQSGTTMIEILVTIGILMIGLLGLAGLQTQVASAEFEGYQRAQALVLVQEFADRMQANKKNASAYVMNDIGVGAAIQDCSALAGAQRDICEFSNELIGAAEKQGAGGASVGAMINARACITNPAPNQYLITVAWQGFTRAGSPKEACGQAAYGTGTRRTVSYPFTVATLTKL